eukprot:NODE_632_length_5775_cov_0.216702.p1 type:complete len:389 gc:universal NODE_632_length_5775_cov_0.216702:1420-2586(+)
MPTERDIIHFSEFHMIFVEKCSVLIFILAQVYGVVLDDCDNVIYLAKSLNVDIKQPALMSQITTDCCNSVGIKCNTRYVFEIDWRGLGLNGYLNSSAIPSKILRLDLGAYYTKTNNISGTIDTLPSSITDFWADSNRLNGTIPELPVTMKLFVVDNNRLSGTLPRLEHLDNLVALSADYNNLGGDIPVLNSALQYLSVRSNINSDNRFSGSIIMDKPIMLAITYNWIADVVFGDTSLLEYCDLSYNPLLDLSGNFTFSKCIKMGLYRASSVPFTISSKLDVSMMSDLRMASKTTFSLMNPATSLSSFSETHCATTAAETNILSEVYIPSIGGILVYVLFAGLVFLALLILLLASLTRKPEFISKFGRKNSFATLNTVNTTRTGQNVAK